MDELMDGLHNGWIDGWMDDTMDGCICSMCLNRSILMNESVFYKVDEWMYGWVTQRID